VFIFPAERCLAAITENVCHGVQPSQQDPLLRLAAADVHHGVEQVGPALAALEGFTDQLVVVCEVSSAVNTGVSPVAAGQIFTKRFGNFNLRLRGLVVNVCSGPHGGLAGLGGH